MDEVLAILSEKGYEAKLLAGGHSLIPVMKLRLAQPSLLVDLGLIDALRGIKRRDDALIIGALTTHAEIARSPDVNELAPALAQAAREIGDRQVRARGTIGGSLSHADPAADYPAAVLALEAQIVVHSSKGERAIPVRDFFIDLLLTDLHEDELITEIRVPAARRSIYKKLPSPASHYALVGVAAVVEGDEVLTSVRLGITGAAPVPFRADEAEKSLVGEHLTSESIGRAAMRAYDGRRLLGDLHASEDYRAALIEVVTRRALEGLLALPVR